ncbi:MAG: archaeosortase H N-terminal-like domain-containing protein [Promethearchaeota archaeon]|jgi:hypothetical protein
MKQIVAKKLKIWILLTINLLFAFSIGITIPQLITPDSFNFGYIMIPLLVILNYIILDRFHFYIKKLNNSEEKSNAEN